MIHIQMIQKYLYGLAAVVIFPLFLHAQKITYSEPEKDDIRSVDFDVIGKINNRYLVYKKIHWEDLVLVTAKM
ncbi:MAG: hypothetical protein ABI405_07760, partial [Parafilimonas sp.]